jgi:hypothetical protein
MCDRYVERGLQNEQTRFLVIDQRWSSTDFAIGACPTNLRVGRWSKRRGLDAAESI